MMPLAGALSAGTQLNRMLDVLGMPDKVGDMMGAMVDLQRGDMAGAQRNLFDAYSGMKTKTLDQMGLGAQLPAFGFMPPPSMAFPQALGMMALSMAGSMGGMAGLGMGGFFPSSPFGMAGGGMGLGGGMMPLVGDFMSRLSSGIGGALSGALSGLMFGGGGAMAGGVLGGVAGFLGGGSGMSGLAGGGFNPGSYAGNDLSSIINNPSLSIEDKMALALMTLASRKEKEVEQKLREMSNNQGGGGAGGPLGGLGQMFGGLGQAFGMGGGQQKSEQILSQELQMIQQKMQRLLDTLSNVMKSFHDTSMTSINNIR